MTNEVEAPTVRVALEKLLRWTKFELRDNTARAPWKPLIEECESALAADTLRARPDVAATIQPAAEGEAERADRDALADAIATAAIKRGIIDGSQPLTGPQLIMLCQDLATSDEAEREFLDASIAVWRELDKRVPYTSANALDASTELRKRERVAWERYRSALEKVDGDHTDCVNSKTATYYNNGTSFEKGK
jgi:hypothetical protein